MKYFYLTFAAILAFCITGCRTMLPAEDIKIFEVCKDEIAVLKNPRISRNSKEKYEALNSDLKNEISAIFYSTPLDAAKKALGVD